MVRFSLFTDYRLSVRIYMIYYYFDKNIIEKKEIDDLTSLSRDVKQ
jgi:hypothetical protein